MSFSLSGIASGLDTNTIISQLMQLEKAPYNKLQTRKTTYNSQLSVFRSINTKLSALRSAAEELKQLSAFNQYSASVSDDKVLKVTATDKAAAADYEIEVKQLAKQHSIRSIEINANDLKKTVEDFLSEKLGLVPKDEGDPDYEQYIQDLEKAKTIKIQVNGKSVEVKFDGDTVEKALNNLMQQINAKDAGLSASLVETNPGKKTLLLTARKSGLDHTIEFWNPTESGQTPPKDQHVYLADGGSGLLKAIGLVKEDYSVNTLVDASNAEVVINNLTITSNSNELKDVVSGLNITLLKEGDSTVTVARDADKVAAKVEAFVKAYNEVVNTIRTQTASGGALQGDFTLRSLQDQLSKWASGRVGPGGKNSGLTYKFLSQIGIEIDKGVTKGSEMTGTITFDKDKFKQALEENPEAVYQLFAHDESQNENSDLESAGIAQRFSELLKVWTRSATGIIAARIDGYNEQIKFITKQMENMEFRLSLREEQLKKQFGAMEVALSSMQSQMAWLNSQIAAMSFNSNW